MRSVPESYVSRIALVRHYTHALDTGGLLVALTRFRVTDREPLYALRPRQQSQLLDLLHEFSYNARRAIELADEFVPGIQKHAEAIKLPGYGETEMQLGITDGTQPLADESLWWVLGRIIHSRDLVVHEREDVEVGTSWAVAPNITEFRTPAAFAVRSDRDSQGRLHYVYTERVVELFLALSEKFERALSIARRSSGC